MQEILTAAQEKDLEQFNALLQNVVILDDLFPPEDGAAVLQPKEPIIDPSSEAVSLGGLTLITK